VPDVGSALRRLGFQAPVQAAPELGVG
jgi:hypothetical protein